VGSFGEIATSALGWSLERCVVLLLLFPLTSPLEIPLTSPLTAPLTAPLAITLEVSIEVIVRMVKELKIESCTSTKLKWGGDRLLIFLPYRNAADTPKCRSRECREEKRGISSQTCVPTVVQAACAARDEPVSPTWMTRPLSGREKIVALPTRVQWGDRLIE